MPTLIRLLPSDAAMTYNTALCFVFAGVGLYAAAMQRSPLALISGSVLTFIGFVTLSEYVFGLDLGVDQVLMIDDIEKRFPFPGRMAMATSIGFTLSGLSILLMIRPVQWVTVPFQQTDTVGLAGTIVVALGVMTILLFLTDMQVPYGWGKLGRSMAVSSAVGFVLLGTGFISWALHQG